MECSGRSSLVGSCGSAAGKSFRPDVTRPNAGSAAGRPKKFVTADLRATLEPAARECCHRYQAQTEKHEGYGVVRQRLDGFLNRRRLPPEPALEPAKLTAPRCPAA
jgi:hypothetical protein